MKMDFQRLKSQGALTIEQLEGYIISIKDRINELQRELEQYQNALKWRKKFRDSGMVPNSTQEG